MGVVKAIKVPRCPRCRYDQSGAVEAWRDRCPLSGVCNECGEALDWSRVCRVDPVRIRWYAEHAPNPRALLWRTPATMGVLIAPGRFWARVRGDVSTRPRTMVWFVLLACVYTHALVSLSVPLFFRAKGGRVFGYRPWSVSYLASRDGMDQVIETIINLVAYPYITVGGNLGYIIYGSEFEIGPQMLFVPMTMAISVFWLIALRVARRLQDEPEYAPGAMMRAALLSVIPIVVGIEAARVVAMIVEVGLGFFASMNLLYAWLAWGALWTVWMQFYWAHFAVRVCRVPSRVYFVSGAVLGSTLAALAALVLHFMFLM